MKKVILLCFVIGFSPSLESAPAQSSAPFQVIVNASNGEGPVAKSQVSRLFLKKRRAWASGRQVLPVDQLESENVRQSFSQEIHGRNVTTVKNYWQARLFAGKGIPPPELRSDQKVVDFVRLNPGAIGYVSHTTRLGDGVVVLKITG